MIECRAQGQAPAPLAPMSAVSTPGQNAPEMPFKSSISFNGACGSASRCCCFPYMLPECLLCGWACRWACHEPGLVSTCVPDFGAIDRCNTGSLLVMCCAGQADPWQPLRQIA